MTWNTRAEPALYRENTLPRFESELRPTTVDATLNSAASACCCAVGN